MGQPKGKRNKYIYLEISFTQSPKYNESVLKTNHKLGAGGSLVSSQLLRRQR
jgi:hypothetical protein